ncbi:MAG TPA: DinB family protein [Coleofasciculaceae cyanobacterium]|jgi:uncharacterized damage-inducible protein DinB
MKSQKCRNHYELMADYNHWMNQKLYAICADIPDDQRRKDVGAFFQSIHGTLNHLLFGDRIWMGRFVGQPFTAKIGELLYADFAQLRQQQEISDRQIVEWSRQLSDEWLSQPFSYVSSAAQKTIELPAWILVSHMFNHQTHHRGQITTVLYQLGYDPGITDIPWLPELNAIV